MTIAELHIAFDIELDKTLDFEYAYILPEKKDYWLNKAQDRFVKSRVFGNNLFRTSFEETQKRIDDIRVIVKQSANLTPSVSSGTFTVTLPDDYLYLVRHQCRTITPTCSTPQLVAGIQTTNDEINIIKKDPFWEAIPDEPLYYIMGNNIVYETSGDFTIVNSLLTYIKKYAQMRNGSAYVSPVSDIQCELPEHTHHEILDLAISMMLENIESPRYQTNLNELTKIE